MPALAFTHYVLVDFENISEVKLWLLLGRSAHATLFLGKAQTKLDLELVEQIHAAGAQVALVRLAGSGRNALDLTLSCYLGKLLQQEPAAQFSILSKDKDFDPMIEHLLAAGYRVLRCEKFSSLPFLPKQRKAAAAKSAPPPAPAPVVPDSAAAPAVSIELLHPDASVMQAYELSPEAGVRLEKLALQLRDNLCPRPRTLQRLLAHINTSHGGKLTESEKLDKFALLQARKVVAVDAQGKLSYPPVS